MALKRASVASAPFCLAFLTDRRRMLHPEPVLRALPAGSAVIYRDYDAPRRAAVARRYQSICRARGVFFIVAGDDALAHAIGADGVHWPALMLARRACRPARVRLVTAACHNGDDLARAAAIGADLALLSPAFATQSHPGAEPLGPERFLELAMAARLPVLALGGVDALNAPLLAGGNVAGIAGISAFCGAADPW